MKALLFVVCVFFCPAFGQTQIPAPDVAEMDAPVVVWITRLHQRLEAAQKEDLNPTEEAALMGQLGNFYHGIKRAETASLFYRNAMALEAENPDWPYFLGLLARDNYDYESALAFFSSVIKLAPSDLHGHVRMGGVLLALGKVPEAKATFALAEELSPNQAVVAYGQARVADAAGDSTAAVSYYAKVLTLQPRASLVHYPYGMALRRSGDLDKATFFLRNRGETEVRFEDPRVDRIGLMLVQSSLQVVVGMAGDPGVAGDDLMGFINTNLAERSGLEAWFESAARDFAGKINGAFTAARLLYVLGVLADGQGDKDRAVTLFQSSIGLVPLADTLFELGLILGQRERLDDAMALFQRALTLDANHNDALYAQGKALLVMNRPEQARDLLLHLVSLEPTALSSRELLIQALAEIGDKIAERDQLKELLLLQEESEQFNSLLRLGDLQHQMNKVDEAAAQYRKCIALEPGSVIARMRLAGSFAYHNRYKEALTAYDEIIELVPTEEAAHLARYAVLVFRGDFKAAKSSLESALGMLSDKNSTNHLLARLLAVGPEGITRDGARALALADEAFKASHNLAFAETYGMALAAAGNMAEAVRWQEQLLGEVQTSGDFDTATRLEANLARYKAGEMCCPSGDGMVELLLAY